MLTSRSGKTHTRHAVRSLALVLGTAGAFLASSSFAADTRPPVPSSAPSVAVAAAPPAAVAPGLSAGGGAGGAAPPAPAAGQPAVVPVAPAPEPPGPGPAGAASPGEPVASGAAAAAPRAPDPRAPERAIPPPAPPVASRSRLAGIYVRFGLGFSSFHDTMVTNRTLDDKPADESRVGGFSTVSEFGIGGSLSRRFVLGAGIYSASIADPSFTHVRGVAAPEELKRPVNFTLFGLMGDFYPGPSHGFHIQAALGLAALSGFDPESQLFQSRNVALGGGAMLGLGYEWAASDRWGVGILGRATGGVASEIASDGQRWFHLVGVSPALLLSVTYH